MSLKILCKFQKARVGANLKQFFFSILLCLVLGFGGVVVVVLFAVVFVYFSL